MRFAAFLACLSLVTYASAPPTAVTEIRVSAHCLNVRFFIPCTRASRFSVASSAQSDRSHFATSHTQPSVLMMAGSKVFAVFLMWGRSVDRPLVDETSEKLFVFGVEFARCARRRLVAQTFGALIVEPDHRADCLAGG